MAGQGVGVLRLHQFIDRLASFNTRENNQMQMQNSIEHWHAFVSDLFTPTGLMRQQLLNTDKNELKQFEIPTSLLARYFFTLFESGIQQIQMMVEHPREHAAANATLVVSQKATFIYWFQGDSHVSHSHIRINQSRMLMWIAAHCERCAQSANEPNSPDRYAGLPNNKAHRIRTQIRHRCYVGG